MRRVLIATLLTALLGGTAVAAETVTDRVFGAGLFDGVTEPTKLHYRYEMEGQGIEAPVTGKIELDVREIATDGGKSVYVDMFDGPNERKFGPIAAREQNPLVLVFLQRDVTEMAKLTGGAAGYFQQQIRRSFNEPAESSPVDVMLGDRKLAGTKLVIHPFRSDPNIARFPQFKEKAYEFVVADGVPGGLYQLASRVPDVRDGHMILEESVTFEKAGP